MISKLERMNMEQEKHEKDSEIKTMEKPQKDSETLFLEIKETLNDHRDINLSEVLKEKEYIETRIRYFDIDCVLDEETQLNIMIERTWEILEKPTMVPS